MGSLYPSNPYPITSPGIINISPLSPPSILETQTTVFSPDFMVRLVWTRAVEETGGGVVWSRKAPRMPQDGRSPGGFLSGNE